MAYTIRGIGAAACCSFRHLPEPYRPSRTSSSSAPLDLPTALHPVTARATPRLNAHGRVTLVDGGGQNPNLRPRKFTKIFCIEGRQMAPRFGGKRHAWTILEIFGPMSCLMPAFSHSLFAPCKRPLSPCRSLLRPQASTSRMPLAPLARCSQFQGEAGHREPLARCSPFLARLEPRAPWHPSWPAR